MEFQGVLFRVKLLRVISFDEYPGPGLLEETI